MGEKIIKFTALDSRQMWRDLRGNMNFVNQRYYTVNRILLEMLGLWPYNNTIFTQIYRVFMLTVFVSSSITQFAKLRDTINNFDCFLYNLTYAMPSLIYNLKLISCIIHGKELRQLFDRVQHDWNTFKDGKEHEIIRYYAISGMQYTIIIYVLVYVPLFVYIISLYIPTFLEFVHPLNESRPKKLPILSEYFFLDEQEYYYPILVHHSMVIGLGIIIVIASETLFMMFFQHSCALFEVVSYRMKHAFDDDGSLMSDMSDHEKYSIFHLKIVDAIIIHNETIKFLDYIKFTFAYSYIILLVFGVITITINLYRLLQAISVMDDWQELVASCVFVVGQYGYLLGINYFCQKITDCSIRMFYMTYEAFWYTAPIRTQKMLIFILQKMMKGYVLNFTNLIIPSLETFASLTSMTLSYLTVIYSVH